MGSTPECVARIETPRLVLRKPRPQDLEDIFARYARDPDVTRFLSWRTHRSLADTRAFLAASDAEWRRWPAGPYLVCSRGDERVLGSAGLRFERPFRAATGYAFAREAWGRGYATEALEAMVALAGRLAVERLYALCHVEHAASQRVLQKCQFSLEGTLRRYGDFPNLGTAEPQDMLCYARILGGKSDLSPAALPDCA